MSRTTDWDIARGDVRAHVWGMTEADVEHAIGRASWGPWRRSWVFVQIERLDGPICPIDVNDGKAIAVGTGDGWAYAVYPVRGASS